MVLFEYKSGYSDIIAQASYLFNVVLIYVNSVLSSNDRRETKILRF